MAVGSPARSVRAQPTRDNDGGGESQLLLHAVRVVGYQFFRLVGELHKFEQLSGALGRGCAIKAIHASGEIKKLRSGQPPE